MTTRILLALFLSAGTALADLDFNRDIRPILSENCIHCHGPDGAERKAGLRLDTFEGATEERGGVQAILPGQLKGSEVWHRIWSDDPDDVMPPPDSKRRLTKLKFQL